MEEQNNLPYIPTGEELEAQMPDFLKEDEWFDVDIGPNILDVTEQYQRPRYTLAFNGVPFAPLGGIHALTGQPGNGKTMTFTQLIVAVLRGEYGGLTYELQEEIPRPTVLYIDTEMEKGNTQLVNLRVYAMMGWDFGVPRDEFKVLWLREETAAIDRWRKTLKAIETFRPTVVFIDGLLDVIGDFNDNKECQNIIYKCMATASHYGISIWCLVHENPGSTKMVGHLGSMLERKVTDAFGTVKKKEGAYVEFTVKQKKARGKDIEDWKFEVVDGKQGFGEPVQLQAPDITEEQPLEVSTMTIDDLQPISMLIIDRDGVTTRDLREAVKKQYKVGATKADKIMALAVEQGIIIRAENKRYYLNDGTSETEDVPF